MIVAALEKLLDAVNLLNEQGLACSFRRRYRKFLAFNITPLLFSLYFQFQIVAVFPKKSQFTVLYCAFDV